MPTVSTPSHDPLIETQVFWVKYRMPIIAGLVAAIVLLAGYGAYRLYEMRRDASAASVLAEAKVAPDYQKVIDQYPGAPAAPSAYLLLAGEQRKEQKFAEANETLQKFIAKHPKHEFLTTAKMAMAANLESLGKTDEALEMYRRIAAEHPKSFNAPLALLAQVHLLKQKSDIEGARRVCETVLTQYRDSYASTEASRYLRTLKPAKAPEVAADAAAPAPQASVSPAGSPAP